MVKVTRVNKCKSSVPTIDHASTRYVSHKSLNRTGENKSSRLKRVETYSSNTQQVSKCSLPIEQLPKHLISTHSLPIESISKRVTSVRSLSNKSNITRNVLQLPRTAWVANANNTHPQKPNVVRKQRDRRKRKACPWWQICCCCLWTALLLGIGLTAMILAITTSKSTQKSTTSMVNTISMTLDNTTTTGSVTTTSTSVTTVSMSTALVTNSTTVLTTTSFSNSGLNGNLLINGDGETGPCEAGNNVTHPTGWNYNGTITQTYYNNTYFDSLNSTSPGPNDRGSCFFYGQKSMYTSMWQTVNLTGTVDPLLIDNQTVKFNLSAWLGGWQYQNDNAKVQLIFFNQINQMVGNITTIGPVLAAARNSTTSLLFRQANGFVPVGTRSFIVIVTLTCISPVDNDGVADNIGVVLFQ